MNDDAGQIARELRLPKTKVNSVLRLLEQGNAAPFVARFRRSEIGDLDEERVRAIAARSRQLQALGARKRSILKSLQSQAVLDSALEQAILAAPTQKRLEDLYGPFRPRRRTLADEARQSGLQGLADRIWAAGKDAELTLQALAQEYVSSAAAAADAGPTGAAALDPPSPETALQGAGRILVEQLAAECCVRQALHRHLTRYGEITVSRSDAAEGKADAGGAGKGAPRPALSKRQVQEFRDYFDFRQPLRSVPPHRVLAINRGESCKVLRVRIQGEFDALWKAAVESLPLAEKAHAEFLMECLREAVKRLVLPSLERELRRELTERSERQALRVFQHNLRSLLLQPPLRGSSVVALDPGFKSGCKAAVLDRYGQVLELSQFAVLGDEQQRAEARKLLADLVVRHDARVIAIGSGAGVRPTEELVVATMAHELEGRDLAYVLVNEAGASIYSTSPMAREELPDCDAVMRSAVSIGRRLLDPLSELVKIDPSHLGIGLYQHDVSRQKLRDSLDEVVESCVNHVGVDINTASPALLRYVAGLNQLTARALYEHRLLNGPFRSRDEFKNLPGFGDATFVQAAGFLRVLDGPCPWDETWVHPESYGLATQVLEAMGWSLGQLGDALRGMRQGDLSACAELAAAAQAAPPALAQQLQADPAQVAQVLEALARAGRDPRDESPPVSLRRSVVTLQDLKAGAELQGTVVNVVDFGAFVDIGVGDNGLVHISELADRYISDPHQVVRVGDRLRVWVLDVDAKRRRVRLSALGPRGGKAADALPAAQPADTAAIPGPASIDRRSARPAAPAVRSSSKPAAAKPSPSAPLTPEMAEGKVPLRSFSDLMQYFHHKDQRSANKPEPTS